MSWTKLAGLAPLFLVACQSFLSFDSESSNALESVVDPDAGEAADGSVEAIPSPAGDAGIDGPAIVVEASEAGATHGPAMVLVVADGMTGDGFLVDSTEVSRGQFAKYLRATNDGTTGIAGARPAACANKTAFAAGRSAECAFVEGDGLATGADLPMSCIEWCTAWAFCNWAGKRLCGARGSGARVPLDQTENVEVSEWFLACGTSDRRRYPYGDVYAPESCATESSGAHGVGLVTCAAGETGPFDMSGNVAEWENGCNDEGTQCAVRGGDYAASPAGVSCEAKSGALAIEAFKPTLGFRCCADPTVGFPVPDAGEL